MTHSAAQTTAPAAMPAQIRAILGQHPSRQDQLLPALHAIQDRLGYIAESAVGDIAGHFNLSRAEVHGVITFYHHFRTAPPARHELQVCRAESCQSMGSDALLAHAERKLGCQQHGHSADGRFSLEPVFCLGHCAVSPAIAIDGKPYARMTPERLDRLLAGAGELA